MRHQLLDVERERFYLNDPCKYSLYGIIPENHTVSACLDGREIPSVTENRLARSAPERLKDSELTGGRRVETVVSLPEDLSRRRLLKVYACRGEKRYLWFQVKVSDLLARRGKPQYFIEEEHVDRKAGVLSLRGWALADTHVTIRLYDEEKRPVECSVLRVSRVDVTDKFRECPVEEECGFSLEIQGISGKYMYLVMRDEEGNKSVYPVGIGWKEAVAGKTYQYGKKGVDYFRTHGVQALMQKTMRKLSSLDNRPVDYAKWLPKHLPDGAELRRQRKHSFAYRPKFSIVVPLCRTKPEVLEQLVSSVKAQTYADWELCLSDGGGAGSGLKSLLEKYARSEPRIRVIRSETEKKKTDAANAAAETAAGEYVAFLGQEDMLTPHALFACAEALNEDRDIELLYSDEDRMSVYGNRFQKPHFKPDFNLDLLQTTNYIGHLFVIKRALLEKTGLFRPGFEGAEEYDLLLRCAEETKHIRHIPMILYHWRLPEDLEAPDPGRQSAEAEAGRRALQEHFDRIGVRAEVYPGEYPELYRTRYLRDHDPLISILIPNKDHIEDLERCISSIEEKSTYRNYEYIIIENNSTDEATFAYYRELEEKNPRVRTVYWEGPFNYSEINNFGAGCAKGEYLLLLNNDTEVISADWMEELLGYCMRPDVGSVGARLYYEDDTVQHAGVILGFGSIAGHCFVQQPRSFSGYQHRIISAQDYSAVTAACMLVKRKVFDEVGGFSPDLAIAFNDIDFCLKIRRAGYLVVYNPYAELYHYESKSRGLEDTPEKLARFNKEIATLESRWPDVFGRTDPYYNPNLTLKKQDFSLKRL